MYPRSVQVRQATKQLFVEVIPDFVRKMKVRLFGDNFALTVRFAFSAYNLSHCISNPAKQDDEIPLADTLGLSSLTQVNPYPYPIESTCPTYSC